MLLQATLVIGSFYKAKTTRKQVEMTILCISCRKTVLLKSMIDLVLTHLNQPWGPPWTLATLGDPW